MDQHSIVAALKGLVAELGKIPTREEFETRTGIRRRSFESYFENWGALKAAAGYAKEDKPQKIDNSIFEVHIEKHLENYKPPEYTPCTDYPTALIISDLHWPFASERVVSRFMKAVEEKQPNFVILNGDAWDMYSHTKFPRSHNNFTPKEERALCLKLNNEFWQRLQSLSPHSKCIQLMGNHDLRPMKRILESYPEAEDWIREALERDFSFPGVRTVFDPREEVFLSPKVVVFHGYRSQLGAHRDYTLLNCINGHSHTGGVVFRQLRFETLWELNSGFAGDPLAKGLTYTPQRITHWTPGYAELMVDGPRFVPC